MKKKNILRVVIAFILCFTTALSLFACGGGNGGNNNEPKTEGTLEFDENGNVKFSNVSLKLETVVAGDDKDAFNDIINKFNVAYRNKIRISVTNTGAGIFEDTVGKKITNKTNAPDIIMSHQKSHKNFEKNNLIQPLNETMTASKINIDLNTYADGLSKYSDLGNAGKIYSIPCDGQSMVFIYNKKELEKTGKQLPTTRAELLEVCKAYKDATNNMPIAWSTGADYFANYTYFTAVLQNGATLYNEKTYTTDWFDNKTNLAAIKNATASINELIELGYAGYNQSKTDNQSAFNAGNRLFYLIDPWSLVETLNAYAEVKKVTVDEVISDYVGGTTCQGWFAMSDNEHKNDIYGDSHFFAMTMTVTDINKKAAILEFINWFNSNVDTGKDWARAGHISMSKTIADDAEYKSDVYVSDFLAKFYPDVNNFRCIGNTPYYAEITNNLKSVFSQTVKGKGDAPSESAMESAIKGAQNAVNNAIGFFG